MSTRRKAPRWVQVLAGVSPGPAVFVAMVAIVGYTGTGTSAEPAKPTPSGERGYASAAETLIAEHGCWTGDAPADMAGKFPGGAIVRKANGTVLYTERPQMVDRALRQALDGEDTGLWAVAFCRGGGQ